MRIIFSLLCILLSIAYATCFFLEIQKNKKISATVLELRRINLVALNLYRNGNIIRISEQSYDSWGNKIQMLGEDRFFYTQSAGPDGRMGSKDDIMLTMAKVASELEANGVDIYTPSEEVAPKKSKNSEGARFVRGQ